MTTRELLARRDAIRQELRSLHDSAGDGDLAGEARGRWDSLTAELGTLESRIERTARLDDLDRRATARPIGGSGDRRLDAEVQQFRVTRAIASAAGLDVDAGRERDISAEIARRSGRQFQGICVPMAALETRVVTTTAPVAGPGGNLIATDHRGDLYIDALRAAMTIQRLGARVLTGLMGNVSIPRLRTPASAGWVAENAALSPSDQEHEAVTLAPKHVGGIVEFSRNLLLQSSSDIEQLVRNDFAALIAREADRVAIQGGGSNEPVGILSDSDVDGTTSLATPTWGGVLELIQKVQAADAEGASMSFLTNAAVVKKLRSTVKVSSTDSQMIMEAPNLLAGYNVAVSSLVPFNGDSPTDKSTLIFGNWQDLIMGFWSELDILVNPYETTAYSKGNVQIRAMATADIALRHPESFCYADDVGI